MHRERGGGAARFLIIAFLLAAVVIGGGPPLVAYFAAKTVSLPEIPPTPQSSIVFASDGRTQLGVIAGSEHRDELTSAQIPRLMKAAIVASEDKDFFTEGGISYPGMYRAGITTIMGKIHGTGEMAGGSTIEQQYAKIALLSPEQTYTRKFYDIGMAQKLDEKYTKDEILTRYLNVAYFGRGAYGVGTAAQAFFGKPIGKLSLAQYATLAAMIQLPSEYAKSTDMPKGARLTDFNYERASGKCLRQKAEAWIEVEYGYCIGKSLRIRRDGHVIDSMLTNGNAIDAYIPGAAISEPQAARAKAEPLGFVKLNVATTANQSSDPYIVDLVRQYITKTQGEGALAVGGLRIYTTIDASLQKAARKAVIDHLPASGTVGSLVSIDPKTGAVIAAANSTTYKQLQFNLAVQGKRQLGSAMKSFVLADAISKGVSTRSVLPAPAYALIGSTRIYNDDRKPHGYLNMDRAFYSSNNPWHLELINGTQAPPDKPDQVTDLPNDPVSPQSVAELAHKLGIDDTLLGTQKLLEGDEPPKLDAVPSLALGTSSVTPLQVTSAYGTWAAGGEHATSYFIAKITDKAGKVLQEHQVTKNRVMESENTARLTRVMQGVLKSGGTARGSGIGRPAAGKTGTTDFDAWFSGFTPDVVTTAWYGFLDNRNLKVNGRQVFGGSSAARAWHDYMLVAHAGKPAKSFPVPASDGEIVLGKPPTPTVKPTVTATPTTVPTPSPTTTIIDGAVPGPTETTAVPTQSPTTVPAPPSVTPTGVPTETPVPSPTQAVPQGPSPTTTITD